MYGVYSELFFSQPTSVCLEYVYSVFRRKINRFFSQEQVIFLFKDAVKLGSTSCFPSPLSLVHNSEISTSTSTNARHTHAHKWLGSWMTDSARAYAWRLCMRLCLSH